MNFDDYDIAMKIVNKFCDITEMMLHKISDGSICGNDMDRYTEQIQAICDTISTMYCKDMYQHQCYLYKVKEKAEKKGGDDNV